MNDPESVKRFRRMGTVTLFAVYFLILVGATVRASGAGMGCPDWPTCFGRWIPPTDESQLPDNYHEIYAVGYADSRFNPLKTWTEYLNRLVGAAIGFLILLTLIHSIPFLKKDKTVFYLVLTVFLLTGLQAWMGSLVVASNLHPAAITAHMLLALVIVALLIHALTRSQRDWLETVDTSGLPKRFRAVLMAAMGMTLLQVAMGTQVREAVDALAAAHGNSDRRLWREHFPLIFYLHRTFSAVLLFTNLWLAWKIGRAAPKNRLLSSAAVALPLLITAAIATGIAMDRFAIPAAAQPAHLLLASLVFGIQFFLFIACRYSRQAAHSTGNTPHSFIKLQARSRSSKYKI